MCRVMYAIHKPDSRDGEFEFLSSTQSCLTDSLENAREECESLIIETMELFEPNLTREEALEELGGMPVIYELDMRIVK